MTLKKVYLCHPIRTPIGRYGGALAHIRADDLAALPLRYLLQTLPQVDWDALDDVILGNTNQAGEDNRNLARMALLLAGLPETIPGVTVNRLCGSGMEAVIQAARAVQTGEAELILAGGAESMSRAPYVMAKPTQPFERTPKLEDSTLGWRFVNPALERQYGVDPLTQTAENLASAYAIGREEQDAYALRSQMRAAAAIPFLAEEIMPVTRPGPQGQIFNQDEHPRAELTLAQLQRLKPLVKADGTVTAGNACGMNDGAAALLVASEKAVNQYHLTPVARYLGSTRVGVPPRIMGIGPAPAIQKLLLKAQLSLRDITNLEINEAFAAQVLAVLQALELPATAENVNPNGGAIALGHPLGMSGTRLIQTAALELKRRKGQYAIASMCIGVGQGIATLLKNIG